MPAPATKMPAGAFPPTHWSVVLTAYHGGSADAAVALAERTPVVMLDQLDPFANPEDEAAFMAKAQRFRSQDRAGRLTGGCAAAPLLAGGRQGDRDRHDNAERICDT